MEVPFARPSLTEADGAAVAAAVASGWVSQGPRVAAFEAAYAERVGAPDAVADDQLHDGAAPRALRVAASAPATRSSSRRCRSSPRPTPSGSAARRPVFADVDPLTYNLDPASAERAITERTKAIMPVHQVGLPADMDAFIALAERYGLELVEDAACAIGAHYKGRPIGSLGPLACFSLHPRKVITTGEGGMIAVHDPAVAARLRTLRQHAMDLSDLARHGAKDIIFEGYPERGWNCRMTDMQAALGLRQLEALDDILGRAQAPGRPLRRRARAASRTSRLPTSPSTRRAPGSPTACAWALTRPSGGPSSCAACCTTASPRAAA